MEDVYEISLLIDFYGQLLTENQLKVMEMYYNEDFSLSEIAEHLEISRQGAHDFIKRGKALLTEYEDKLQLVKKFEDNKNSLNSLIEYFRILDYDSMGEMNAMVCRKIEDGIMNMIADA